MKLKYINVNGYGVLVDESAKLVKGDLHIEKEQIINTFPDYLTDLSECKKILFAEKELNLDVPILNWREWEVEQLIKESCDAWNEDKKEGILIGYNHDKTEFTKEDLRKAFNYGKSVGGLDLKDDFKEFIQSLQKYPKYIVMETLDVDAKFPKSVDSSNELILFINSDGKQEGIIKEILW